MNKLLLVLIILSIVSVSVVLYLNYSHPLITKLEDIPAQIIRIK